MAVRRQVGCEVLNLTCGQQGCRLSGPGLTLEPGNSRQVDRRSPPAACALRQARRPAAGDNPFARGLARARCLPADYSV